MSQSPNKPLHRQFNRQFVYIAVLFTLTLALAYSLFFQRDHQLKSVSKVQLPALKAYQQNQQVILETLSLISVSTTDRSGQALTTNHRQMLTNLQQVSSLKKRRSPEIDKLILQIKSNQQDVDRVGSNISRNEQLKQSSLIQLRLVVDSLTAKVNEMRAQQQNLYLQILNDKVNDRVTANRARAHAKLVKELSDYQYFNQTFIEVLSLFNRLSIFTSLDDFQLTNEKVSNAFSAYEMLTNDKDTNTDEKELFLQLKALEGLLLTEQRTLPKWHGFLRLAEAYFSSLNMQRQVLQNLLSENKAPTFSLNENDNVLPAFLSPILQNSGLKLTSEKVNILLIVALLFSLFLFVYLLRALQKNIRKSAEATLAMCQSIITNGVEQDVPYNCIEDEKIATLINEIKNPRYTSQDYLALESSLLEQQTIIAEQSGAVYWQMAEGSLALNNEQLIRDSFLDDLCQGRSWRHWFDKANLSQILSSARLAKSDKSTQVVRVITKDNQALILTLTSKNQLWFGTISSANFIVNLEQSIETLEQQILEINKQNYIVENLDTQQLTKMIIRTMLQSQSRSIDSGVSSAQIYRQLSRVYDWSKQKQTRLALQSKLTPLQLSDNHFHDELYSVILNARAESSVQRNQISLYLDEQLAENVNLDVKLFHQLILGLCRTCLTDQFKSKLNLDLQLVDKKQGQQIVRFNFSHISTKKQTQLPETIKLLTSDNLANEGIESPHYLALLLARLNCSAIESTLAEDGFQFKFDLPLAILDSQQKNIDKMDLKLANTLVVSKDVFNSAILAKHIKAVNGKVDTLTKFEKFKQQVNVKRLTSKPLAVVILLADSFHSNYKEIQQQIATLPASMRPKLMVMQSAVNVQLQKQGLYSLASDSLSRRYFLTELQALIKKEANKKAKIGTQDECISNHILTAQECKNHQYEVTQVEVLLAVTKPAEHEAFVRLLSWFGFTVRIVCQAQMMEKQWQSGKYLVLFTQFTQMPFVDLVSGKTVHRGVFHFKDEQFTELSNAETKVASRWKTGKLPALSNLDSLTTLLSPWLKVKSSDVAAEKVIALNEKKSTTTYSVVNDSVVNDAVVNDSVRKDSEANNPASDDKSNKPILLKSDDFDALEAVFNLDVYAKNQGSAELAALMLDEYILLNAEALSALEQVLKAKDYQQAQIHLERLILNAKIMGADKLQNSCESLVELITKKEQKKAISLLANIALEIAEVVDYAEAI